MKEIKRGQVILFICLFLGVLTIAAYRPIFSAEFVSYDDGEYVTENSHVKGGLTREGVSWAFHTGHMGSWHPVTWLSHMLDVKWFGLNPAAHHATNLVFHVANTLLLFFLLHRTTGSVWRSAFAAALFALHPLRVESVAWVSERKDVLSAFFGLWSLIFYAQYASSGVPPMRSRSYWLALLFLVLGLMSKPMLVTWPVLMLLLDWWPLRRGGLVPGRIRRLLAEKIPFVLAAMTASVITIMTQRGSGAVITLEELPFGSRLQNAVLSVGAYVGDFFWPAGLACFYPYQIVPPSDKLFLAGCVLVVGSIAAWRFRAQRPYLSVGWCWFLVSLLPVIGLVQAGYQARADRYMYLPGIGLGLAVAWLVGDLVVRVPKWRNATAAFAGCILAVLALLVHRQSAHWRSTETLFRHALAVTTGNFIAHQSLGDVLLRRGESEAAFRHFEEALRINPRIPEVRNNLAVRSLRAGRYAEAVREFEQVLKERPHFILTRFNLAQALEGEGRISEAIAQYREYVARQPLDVEASVTFARCLAASNQHDEAIAELQRISQVQPRNFLAHFTAGNLLEQKRQTARALAEYELALQAAPDTPAVLNNVAWILATHFDAGIRDGNRAVKLAERACELTQFQQPMLIGTLGAAYAEADRFDDALKAGEKARSLAQAAGLSEIAARNEALLELYRNGKKVREPAPVL